MSAQEPKFEDQIGQLWGYIKGYHAVHLVSTGDKLGLFASLKAADEGLSAEDLAAAHDLHAPYVAGWCKTAGAFGFLDGDDSTDPTTYRLAPFFDLILASPGDPRHLANYCTTTTDHFHADLERHPDFFKTGDVFSYQEHGPAFTASIADLTGGLQSVLVHHVLPKLPDIGQRLQDDLKVLDMGCGAGGLMLRLAGAFPAMTCVGVDVDGHGIELAALEIDRAGMVGRVSAELVDGGDIGHENEFDLVTMFEVLHELPLAVRDQVMANCAKALKPGGKLLIIDETYPAKSSDLRKPEYFFPVLTGYNEMTWGNVVPTRADQDKLIADAGLVEVHRDMIGGMFTVIMVEKPA
ncbi:MAG: class I SAM-dependent methyltransferase [Alphaproteobacteria bacterium]|jgi:SAM-dependent methyltransferase|nr:class I SAM-dependent methyltransferase [Alphaproteobacteria bacterium]MBT4965102.1 class I SAM-dependent methyltransferase [Alphaproteobacteria bacterium]MBT5160228.1 class I SAM-dependent methyltransferase [Alphaproteobacteria bacterium]MBT5917023.1 class I SAM-dependent methyltransferase [Alphaproteobacteria bacterium]MBT6385292.1 class I SAM-dependent methyltransferase [Alphaproteobacteria bacterium]